jgi:hypothetical protein
MPKRRIWELFLLVAGFLYVLVVLCGNVECLSFAAAYVALATEDLVYVHREKRCHDRCGSAEGKGRV